MKFPKLGFSRWKDPDYAIRLDFAQRSSNEAKLLYLALNDVNESVRVAAIKGLGKESSRLQVVEESVCDQCLKVVVGLIREDATRGKVALQSDLPTALRLEALEAMEVPGRFIPDLISDPSDAIAIYAIERCSDLSLIEAIYSDDLPDKRALPILKRIENEVFALNIYEQSKHSTRRIAALEKICSPEILKDLYLKENDSALRLRIIERTDQEADLARFFEEEDEEDLRVKIIGKIADPEILFLAAIKDHNIEVRSIAVEKVEDPSKLLGIAKANHDHRITNAILRKSLPLGLLKEIALHALDPNARIEAVLKIEDENELNQIAADSGFPETAWFAYRRLGTMPFDILRCIESSQTLARIAELDSQKLVRFAAIRQIKEERVVRRIVNSADPSLAAIASIVLKEFSHPVGIRFLDVPERPYQLSVFPVTCEQFGEWKSSRGLTDTAAKYFELKDLPVTDLTIDEARAFCEWLSVRDNAHYRLPFYDEWEHATLTGSGDWFSTGEIRAHSDAEQMDLVLFGTGKGARAMHQAVSNPWGFLDMVGNVMEWCNDPPISELMLKSTIPLDELAQTDSNQGDTINVADYAHASGNHWGDRRIRKGRWKRLVHRANLESKITQKVGFRVLRTPVDGRGKAIDYNLILSSKVAAGYSVEQVVEELSHALSADIEDIRRRYSVVPSRITTSRKYDEILRIKQTWENCGAITKVAAHVSDS